MVPRESVVVHRPEPGKVAMSTEHGIVWLTAVEARQLALDLTRASGPGEPRPGLTWLGVVLGGLAPLIFTATLLVVALVIYGIGLMFGLV